MQYSAKVLHQPQNPSNIKFSRILNKKMQSLSVVQQSKITSPLDGAGCSLSESFGAAFFNSNKMILVFVFRRRGLRAETIRFARSPSSTSPACSSFPPGTSAPRPNCPAGGGGGEGSVPVLTGKLLSSDFQVDPVPGAALQGAHHSDQGGPGPPGQRRLPQRRHHRLLPQVSQSVSRVRFPPVAGRGRPRR